MKLIVIVSMLLQQTDVVFSFKTSVDSIRLRRLSTTNRLWMTQQENKPIITPSIKPSIKTNLVACSLFIASLFGSPDNSFATTKFNSISSTSPLLLSGEEMMSPQASRINKFIPLPSGVEYYDAIVGEGSDVVKEGSSVQFQWVLRR